MRAVRVQHRRSRSRSPRVRGSQMIVNELDSGAVSKAREPKKTSMKDRITVTGEKSTRERITCTIPGPGGPRGPIASRLSGGRFEQQRHSSGNGFPPRFPPRFDSGHGRRGDFRVSFGSGGIGRHDDRNASGDAWRGRMGGGEFGSPPLRSATQPRDHRSYEERKREEEEKPVLKLVDPQVVPRSTKYFGHDDRSASSDAWRGRSMYDPRKDTGRGEQHGGRFFGGGGGGGGYRNNRPERSGGWDGYGGRPFGGRGGDSYDRRRDDGAGLGGGGAGGGGGWRRAEGFGSGGGGGADGMWTHDKFMELSDGEDAINPDEPNVVVVDSSRNERKVEE